MTEKKHLTKLVEKTKKWIVYWYDTQEWHELNLTDPAFYAEHLYKSDIECILVPKKCYDDPKWKIEFTPGSEDHHESMDDML